jgi:hypothetical protein
MPDQFLRWNPLGGKVGIDWGEVRNVSGQGPHFVPSLGSSLELDYGICHAPSICSLLLNWRRHNLFRIRSDGLYWGNEPVGDGKRGAVAREPRIEPLPT